MIFTKLLKGKTDNTLIQFFRYTIVGGGATVIQWGLLVFLKEIFQIDTNAANLVGFLGGLLANYFISRIWVFDKDKSSFCSVYEELAVFAMIGVVGLLINQGMIWLFDKVLSEKQAFNGIIPANKYYLIGQVLATAIAFFWNFIARKVMYSKSICSVDSKQKYMDIKGK